MSFTLLIGFSATANASTVAGYDIRQDIYVMSGNTIIDEYWYEFTPNNNQEETDTWGFGPYVINTAIANNYFYRNVWNIFFDNEFPFELNKVNRVSLENFYWAYLINQTNGGMVYGRGLTSNDTITIVLDNVDGTTETITPSATADSDYSLDISFSFTPTKNVSRMTVIIDSPLSQYFTVTTNRFELTGYLGEIKGDSKHNFNLEIQSEEAGLLSGLLGWVQNIFSKITDTLAKVGEIAASITELPQKLWIKISDGLKSLFIPSSEELEQFISKMDNLLESKFGAVYQVVNTTIESWERVKEADATDTIDMPEVTIALPENNEFTFGGYNIKIVPDGFTAIVTALKSIVGIVCTVAFINGLRKRYDEVMGVDQ